MLQLTIQPRHGRHRPPLADREGVALLADVVVDAAGVVRVLTVAALPAAEGSARFIGNAEQGHWAREECGPLLAEALGHQDWPAAFAALKAAETAAGRKVRAGRIRCEIEGREG